MKYPRSGWRRVLALAPGMGATLLPIKACPACWPLYSSLLSAFGLGFLLHASYVLPISAALLGVWLISLCYHASERHGYGPFVLGFVGASVALVGRFELRSDALVYPGIAALAAAAIWNSWPRKRPGDTGCEQCKGALTRVEEMRS